MKSGTVKAIVREFYDHKRDNPNFYVEELLQFVKERYGDRVSLQTPYRRLRELEQEGLVHYVVDKSKFTFCYEMKG